MNNSVSQCSVCVCVCLCVRACVLVCLCSSVGMLWCLLQCLRFESLLYTDSDVSIVLVDIMIQ